MPMNLFLFSKFWLFLGLLFILSPEKGARLLSVFKIGKKRVYDEMEEEKLGGARVKTGNLKALGIILVAFSVVVDAMAAWIYTY